MIQGMVVVTLATLQASASAEAPPKQPAPLTIDLLDMAARKQGCRTTPAEDGTVVVCGRREEDRYRIDPETLSVLRSKDPANANPNWRNSLAENKCSPVGQFGCMQGPAIDFFAVAGVLVRLAKGESIASIAKTSPDEYDAYMAAKAQGQVDGE